MTNEPRKATDIILSLERQINNLNSALSTQDMLLKVISNKLTEVLKALENKAAPKFTVEAINTAPQMHVLPPGLPSGLPLDPEKQIPVSSEASLSVEHTPNGFRRTSRPETFEGDNSYLNRPAKKKDDQVSFPVQIPKSNGNSEVVVPDIASNVNKPTVKENKLPSKQASNGNNVPTMQRIVDRNGKSVFLADVEIIDLATIETIAKTRTNGTGKWQASLPVGEYKVVIKKLESLTKQKVEVAQNIRVDGTQSPLELQMMIIK